MYDYDVTGAYPTAMSMLDYPDYKQLIRVRDVDFSELQLPYELMKCYSGFKVEFNFPTSVAYPNIPVSLDESNVIFPSSGTSYCTGIELLLAQKLGCTLRILDGVVIPFKSHSNSPKSSNPKSEEKLLDKESMTRKKYVCDERINAFVEDLVKRLQELNALDNKRNVADIETTKENNKSNTTDSKSNL